MLHASLALILAQPAMAAGTAHAAPAPCNPNPLEDAACNAHAGAACYADAAQARAEVRRATRGDVLATAD